MIQRQRSNPAAKFSSVDLSQATNILNTKWDEPSTTASLEALGDPASGEIRVLPNTLVLDLNPFKEMPEKIEGVAVIDRNAIAVSNDNDFYSAESKYDEQGNNVSKGKVSQILVISLDKPLPFVAK